MSLEEWQVTRWWLRLRHAKKDRPNVSIHGYYSAYGTLHRKIWYTSPIFGSACIKYAFLYMFLIRMV